MNFPVQERLYRIVEAFQYLLQKYTSIFVFQANDSGVGNSTEELLYALMRARRTGKKVLFLRRWTFRGLPTVANKEIYRLKSPYLLSGMPNTIGQFVGNSLLTLLFGPIPAAWNYFLENTKNALCYAWPLLRWVAAGAKGKPPRPRYIPYQACIYYRGAAVERLWNPEDKMIYSPKFSLETARSVDWESQFSKPITIQVDPSKVERGNRNLENMGIKRGDWFVCLHCREGGFKHDATDARNVDIMSYLDAIQEITAAGGWVVRMGDSTMKRLPKMERVIDYPFTEFKSEFMDIFLIQQCRFYFGQNSGVASIAMLFSKSSALVNMTEWVTMTPKAGRNLMILKHQLSKRLNRRLTLQEILASPTPCQDFGFVDPDIVLQGNSSDEIRNLVREVLELDEVYRPDELQNEFNARRRRQILGWVARDPLCTRWYSDRYLKYRMMVHLDGMKLFVGRKFLKENWGN